MFFERMEIDGLCWMFPAKTVYYRGKVYKPHRLAYQLVWGEVPETISHQCKNRWCCNPNHLTSAPRRYATGKQAPQAGENHHLAILNEAKVRAIRKLAQRGFTHEDIAWVFGVKRSTISAVVGRYNWAHVD